MMPKTESYLAKCFSCPASAFSTTPEETDPRPIPQRYYCSICGRDPAFVIPTDQIVDQQTGKDDLDHIPLLIYPSPYSSPPLPSDPAPIFKQSVNAQLIPITQEEARSMLQSSGNDDADVSGNSILNDLSNPCDVEEITYMNLSSPNPSVKSSTLDLIVELAEASRHNIAVSICSPRILMAAMVPLRNSGDVQIRAIKAIMVLAKTEANRLKILGCGAVLPLLDILRMHDISMEACTNAVLTLFYLACHEGNRMQMGVLGAIPPLLEMVLDLRPEMSYYARNTAAMALFQLTLSSYENCTRLANVDAAPKLLAITADNPMQCYEAIELRLNSMSLLHNLCRDDKGMGDLLIGRAVGLMVRLLREGRQGMECKYCLAVLYNLFEYGPVEFRKQALEAGAEAVLAEAKEEWEEDGRDHKANIMMNSLTMREDQFLAMHSRR